MKNHSSAGRRQFLQTMSALAAGGAGSRMLGLPLAGIGAAAAQSSAATIVGADYRALVCLFMHGGNDGHNWVVPIDPTGYAEYARSRGELAWPLARLQPIGDGGQGGGRAFGMPEELAPLRKWYQAGKAAVVANVGTLVRPVSVAEFKAGRGLPSKLFSHNDQASNWQSLSAEGARTGWGGRLGDLLASSNAYPVFTAVSANGNAVFLSGSTTTQYQVGADGIVTVRALSNPWLFGSGSLAGMLPRNVAATSTNPLQAEYARVMQRSLDTSTLLGNALGAPSTLPAISPTLIPISGGTTTLDKSPLARQLAMVARLIVAGQRLGMRRQVFMVGLGGFDTHANQMRDHPGLMAQVAHSIDYFLDALAKGGMLDNVALFTASDFGRTLLSNGDGSDHGWGSHHFVAGGSVVGGSIRGRFPSTTIGTPDDIGSGRLLPSLSVSQLAAPLGRWMGLSEADLSLVLPGISNFDSAAIRVF